MQEQKRICPRDKTPLQSISYETETVSMCPQCGGFWCDNDELAMIIENHIKKFSTKESPEIKGQENEAIIAKKAELTSTLACVVCSKTLQRVNYSYSSGIFIDRCSLGHGVWLDKGEIEKLQIFVERWSNNSDRLQKSYGNILRQVGQEAALSLQRAQAEGLAPYRKFSLLGRLFDKIFYRKP